MDLMERRPFFVEPVWDENADVFWSKSNIGGFHIEARNLEEFRDVMKENMADLIIARYLDFRDHGRKAKNPARSFPYNGIMSCRACFSDDPHDQGLHSFSWFSICIYMEHTRILPAFWRRPL